MRTNQEYRNLEDKVKQLEAEKAVLQEALNKLDASIPQIKAQVIREAIDSVEEYGIDLGHIDPYGGVMISDLEEYANQIEKGE